MLLHVGANSFHMLNANELEEARVQVSKWTQVWEFEMCSLLCRQQQGCSRR